MRAKRIGSLAAAGIVVLLAGCVSTKKYKAAEASLQQLRSDSSQLAQQVTSLNGNVQDLQQKNTTLQQSLQSSTSNYATQQKKLDYYQNYFSQQQSTISQVSDQLKGSLSQAGLGGDENVQQENNCIYVRLDEDKLFKKNGMTVTPSGKQALNSLAQTFKDRSDVNVFVSDGDSTGGQGSVTTAMSSSGGGNNANYGANNGNMEPKHHMAHHHHMASGGSASTGNGSTAKTGTQSDKKSAAGNQAANMQDTTAVAHHKPHHHHMASEGSMTYYNNMEGMHKNRAYALKEGRMYAVATNFLNDGVPKVNLTMHQPAMYTNPQSNTIKVIITPTMNDFNPQQRSSQ